MVNCRNKAQSRNPRLVYLERKSPPDFLLLKSKSFLRMYAALPQEPRQKRGSRVDKLDRTTSRTSAVPKARLTHRKDKQAQAMRLASHVEMLAACTATLATTSAVKYRT